MTLTTVDDAVGCEPVVLEGVRPDTLAGYLVGLGVLRILGTQHPSPTRGAWQGGRFVVEGVTADELQRFLLEQYAPTPVVSPWNGGSGFYPKDSTESLDAILNSESPRVERYRVLITAARAMCSRADVLALTAPGGGAPASPKGDAKYSFILTCRSEFPDDALEWLDAAVVLTEDRAVFPPLLGTGGNDGRLDFSNNFMGHLCTVLGLIPAKRGEPDPGALLTDALFASGAPKLGKKSLGQFDAGAAGTPNSAPNGSADWVMNPWVFVLMIEGAVAFSAGVARRAGSNSVGRASMPFTVDAVAAGFGTAGDEESRGELWLPLWSRPAAWPSIGRLFREGRLSWNRGQARTGADAGLAVASLGVDRGIGSFARFGLATRNGLATVATPLGRIAAAGSHDARPVAALDQWRGWVRDVSSAAARASARRLEQARLDIAADPSNVRLRQDLLIAAVHLEQVLRRSGKARGAGSNEGVPPIWLTDLPEMRASSNSGLRPSVPWLDWLDDGSPEFRVALGIAWLNDPVQAAQRRRVRDEPNGLTIAAALRGDSGSRHFLDDGPSRRLLSVGTSHRVFGLMARRASMEGRAPGDTARVAAPQFRDGVRVPIADLELYLAGVLDSERVLELAAALTLVPRPQRAGLVRLRSTEQRVTSGAALWFDSLRYYFSPERLDVHEGQRRLLPQRSWLRWLEAGRWADLADAVPHRRVIDGQSAEAATANRGGGATPTMPLDPAATVRLGWALLCHVNDEATTAEQVQLSTNNVVGGDLHATTEE